MLFVCCMIHCQHLHLRELLKDTHFVEDEVFTDEEQTDRHDAGENGRDEPRHYYKQQSA